MCALFVKKEKLKVSYLKEISRKERKEIWQLEKYWNMQREQIYWILSVCFLCCGLLAIGWTSTLLHRLAKKQHYSLRPSQYPFILFLFADLFFVLGYLPYHSANWIRNTIQGGTWCILSVYGATCFCILSQWAIFGVAYVSYRNILFSLKVRPSMMTGLSFLAYVCVGTILGIIWGITLQTTGRTGNFRGLYCFVKHPDWYFLVSFLVYSILVVTGATVYFHRIWRFIQEHERTLTRSPLFTSRQDEALSKQLFRNNMFLILLHCVLWLPFGTTMALHTVYGESSYDYFPLEMDIFSGLWTKGFITVYCYFFVLKRVHPILQTTSIIVTDNSARSNPHDTTKKISSSPRFPISPSPRSVTVPIESRTPQANIWITMPKTTPESP